jgi:hypothetical protein
MADKLFLKDLVGKKDLNIMIDITIWGQKLQLSLDKLENHRLLKSVQLKKGWIYVYWEPGNDIILCDGSRCHDCGYSGLQIGDTYHLEDLYLKTV